MLLITASAAVGEPDEQTERRISHIINELQPLGSVRDRLSPKATLTERMSHYQTPGVSIAIINDYQVEWVKGFGVKEWGKAAPISTQTLFQAASISKMVFAVAVMTLVEQGKLDLDRDINDYLQSSKVPSNGEWQPIVNLHQILSHSAGFTVSGFPGYSSKDSLPSVLDVLQGRSPSKTGKVEVNILPGLQSRYSGGGTLFAQVAITDALQRNFSELMREVVLDPLAMRDSTFEQPLPRSRRKQAATGHPWHYRALEGKWKTFPEQAAAGLWTTPTDLAKLGIMLQRALGGEHAQILSSNAVAEMLTAPTDERVGLGVFLEGKGENERFGHGGWNDGFTCEMKLYRNFGIGAVVMVNSNQGSDLINEILNAIAEEYSWPGYRSKQLPRWSLAVVTGIFALGCLALRIAYPANMFLFAMLMNTLAISTLLLLPSTLVGRIATRGGSRRDGDVATAIVASYVIGQFVPLFY